MIPYFDAHCDTITKGQALRCNTLHLDLERLHRYGPCAQVFAIFDRPPMDVPDYDHGDAPEAALTALCDRHLNRLRDELAENADLVMLCGSAADLRAAAAAGKISALIAVEGAELLGCSVEKLERAYVRGVRIVNLTWNFPNALSGSAMSREAAGLTEQGRHFVRCAQKMGVIVDLSHTSERGFWDVAEIAEKPILAGHSNAKALCDHPRNLTDAQFLELKRLGGCAGLNLYPEFLGLGRNLEAVIAHAEHFWALGGMENVCLGTDFDGISCTPVGLSGVEDLERLYEALLRRNHPETLVRALFYDNLMRVMEVCL